MARSLLSAALLLFVSSCSAIVAGTEIDPPIQCATGITCPAGQKCAKNQAVCITTDCGDGMVQPPEQCDDGNLIAGDGCESDCTAPLGCGNSVVEGVEQCDAGPVDTATCNGDCTFVVCGDGRANAAAGEACDDGNTVTEVACPYGTPTCTGCNATCNALSNLTGPYCGDGIVNGTEGCDDGNTLACGTCSANCSTPVAFGFANGFITPLPASSLGDTETFTISDGINAPTIFEFNKSGGVLGGRIAVDLTAGDTVDVVATKMTVAINGVTSALLVTASVGVVNVDLIHDRATVAGNVPLSETVANPGFVIGGMTGGAAGDCPAGVGCKSNADCAPPDVCGPVTKTCGP